MKIFLYSAMLLLVLTSVSNAQDFANLKASDVKKLIDSKSKAVIVDARTGEEYLAGHIPSAINIPPQSLPIISSLLPSDKKISIVFYCRGMS